jgi:hypothetical protein
MTNGSRQFLNPGGLNPMIFDRVCDRVRIADDCENIGFWKYLAECLQHFFPTPHFDQPMVD